MMDIFSFFDLPPLETLETQASESATPAAEADPTAHSTAASADTETATPAPDSPEAAAQPPTEDDVPQTVFWMLP